MNTKYAHKLLMYSSTRIEVRRKMYTSKFRVALVVVILSAIISIGLAGGVLQEYCIISSSGSISPVVPLPSEAYNSEIRGAFFKAQSMSILPDWNLVTDTLADYNIDILAPETMGISYAMIPNPYVPYGDPQLANAISLCHAKGIEFYAHIILLMGSPGPEYSAVNSGLVQTGWSCPTKQATRTRWQNLIEHLVTNYDIDGIMIDYARYEPYDLCYCPDCKAKFEEYLGEGPITVWPGDFAPEGTRGSEFMEWRSRPINDLVRDIRNWALAIKPNIQICGCVWPIGYDPPNHQKYWLGQDTFTWIKEDWVDWVTAMMYTQDLSVIALCTHVGTTYWTGGPKGKLPFLPFLANAFPEYQPGAWPTPAQFSQQIETVRANGADGWIIFSYGGPGEFVGYAPDIRPYLDAINLYPTFSIKDITASPTSDSCTITWTTDLPATSKVEYSTSPLFDASLVGPDPSYGIYYWDIDHIPGTVVEDATPLTDHHITLTSLLPGTKYYFRVQSQDPNGIATSKVQTFTTK